MNLHVTKEAAEWYKQEFDINQSAHLRYYVRYGFGGHIPGFSLGVRIDNPNEIHASSLVDGITFFIETADAWYFEAVDLRVQWNKQKQEPEFIYD
ncbi:hypothetical protein WMZ97_18075 [Lentibacillus sp. N15]|uniref:HesB/YadR/YfhF family protein n=1 Tax=Lentibacillus songyuanensis TaxID=3136161 RepID=UPI0031BAA126